MRDLFMTYEAASGQAINFDRFSIFFSINVSLETRVVLLDILGVFMLLF